MSNARGAAAASPGRRSSVVVPSPATRREQAAERAGPLAAERVDARVVDQQDVGLERPQPLRHRGERAGRGPVGRMDEPHEVAGGLRQAGVAAGAETAALAEVQHAHALVARGERVEQLGAVVGRRVVDGDELDVGCASSASAHPSR